MPEKIVVYTKPTCSKCREADKLLRECGVEYEKVNYYTEPISEEKLRELLKKMKLTPRELLRKSESTYRELGLAKDEFSDDELVALMIKHPELMQRPIVERGSRAVLGRPVENIRGVIGDK